MPTLDSHAHPTPFLFASRALLQLLGVSFYLLRYLDEEPLRFYGRRAGSRLTRFGVGGRVVRLPIRPSLASLQGC